MKYTVLLLLLVVGCSSAPPQKMVTSCENRTKEQIMTEIASLVISERMKITNVNDYIGLLEATRDEGQGVVSSWQFVVRQGSIDAYARVTDGVIPWNLDEDPPRRLSWYWSVRRGIEKMCGEHVRFIPETNPMDT